MNGWSSARVLALMGATAVWGSTFVVTKGTLAGMSEASFLVWRFGIAAVVLAVARPRWAGSLTSLDLRHGVLLGVFLGLGFLLQTGGLREVTASASGFLTGTMVVLTPVAAAAVFGERVGPAGWVAVLLALGGVGLLALREWSMGSGALLTIAGAGMFALHIAGLSRWATAANSYGITVVSVSIAAVLCTGIALAGDGVGLPPTGSAWMAVLYLALVATCVGFAVQAWAQSGLSATTAAVVMTFEPVFAALVAVVTVGEILPIQAVSGGVLVVVAMFIAELGPRECCDAMSPRIECC